MEIPWQTPTHLKGWRTNVPIYKKKEKRWVGEAVSTIPESGE